MINEYENHCWINGFLVYMRIFRESPWQALQEIGACILIVLLMFAMLWVGEISGWIAEVIR